MKMRLIRTTRTSPPWSAKREATAGEIVNAIPATNQPGTGKYWLHPTSKRAEWACDAEDGSYGVLAELSDLAPAAMTPSELKYRVENAGHDSHFFDRSSMRFFGDTMRNYGCRWSDRYGCWELYRKRPVKHGLRDSAYFDAETFRRTFPDKSA